MINQHATSLGFSAVELLMVVGIIVVIAAMLMPVITMLREGSRRSQAGRVVAQLEMGINMYATEDAQRSPPPQDGDGLIRSDATGKTWHLIDAMLAMHMDNGVQTLVEDPSNAEVRVLVDPWKRPYRYQVDSQGLSNPTLVVLPARPDPNRLDWNARNQVPYGYVWSLGTPVKGHFAQWANDPDAVAGSGAPWIYARTAPVGTP